MENGNIQVSSKGTVSFDFSLSFTHAGPTVNNQPVSQYRLKTNSNTVVSCADHCTIDDTDPHHWWTVENGPVFVLHQAKSTDRGLYTAEVEVRNPKDDSLNAIEKSFHVTCK